MTVTVADAVRARRGRGVRRWAAPLAVVVAGLLGGCAGIDPDPHGLVAAASTGSDAGGPRDGRWTADELRGDFERFASKRPGEVAVAWAPVGSRHEAQTLGQVRDEDAWSTAKVPLGVARLRLAGGKLNEKTFDVLRRAITNSDNAAARILWQGLGTPEEAVALMEKVLRETGDETTTFSREAFGRSMWTVSNQAQFVAGLPCIADGPTVLDLMDEINPDHRWGLGAVNPQVQFKGGWGIGKNGLLVRQLGVVSTAEGSRIGIAVTTTPHTKDMAVAASNLEATARWLLERLGPGDGGGCG